jgi:mono/diheme cytochrome c family protein
LSAALPSPQHGDALAATAFDPGAARPVTFERDIRPILKQHCVHCHGEGDKLKGGIDVRLRRFLVSAHGDTGDPAVIPGKPDKSLLLELVKSGEMPEKGKKLNQDEVQLIERWIAEGAITARTEPEQVPRVWITEEEREFWAFQPIIRPDVPKTKSVSDSSPVIDRFIAAKLEAKKLSLNPEASKSTLLRRVALDLTGLPPTPEETAVFMADSDSGAYGRMVDRYLASPHYGERWARHWLDLAGYADSDGYSDADPVRPWAFQYRDYVIRALNSDKPLDRFIQEQLAGDEINSAPLKDMAPETIDKIAATGFLRMVPDGTAGAASAEQLTARNAVVAETIKVVSTSLLGLSVGCAQCHDHKHDPIPQSDYYQLRAVFEPGFDLEHWRVPGSRLVSLMTTEERKRSEVIEADAKAVDTQRKAREDELIELVLGWELQKRPEELRDALRAAYRTEAKQRTPEQLKLLKEHPTINQLSPGSLYLYDRGYNTKHEAELKVFTEKAAAIRKAKPVEPFLPVFNELPAAAKAPPKTLIFHRGDPMNPKDEVEPKELTILASPGTHAFGTKPTAAKANPATSGRRLDFAQHITSGTHPLLTRVLVNRVWHHHFGRGIVGTPSDFGRLGDRPSHPELLDWLATELVARKWSLKELHRTILNSATYKQTSERSQEKDALDPDNLLLSRTSIRRLDAETLRDSMLVASGKLNRKMFGAPVPVTIDLDGQVIVGVDTTDTAGRPSGKIVPLNGEEFRRSVYVQMRRNRPLGMLETFDLPKMEPNCEARAASTVAPQSLALMNSAFCLQQAELFADRILSEAGSDPSAQIRRAWLIALQTEPTTEQLENASQFLKTQTATLQASTGITATAPTANQNAASANPPTPSASGSTAPKPAASTTLATSPPIIPARAALATLCQALLNSNAFLYID